MKKFVVFMMVFLLALTSVFAQGSKEAAAPAAASTITAEDLKNANITLEFWHAQTKENGIAMDKVVALFNETNPYGITVNATCQGSYNDTHTKLLAALSAGNQPNVGQAYNNNMMTYMPSGKLMELTAYLEDDFGLTAEDKATIVPSYWGENCSFPDGKIYATSLGKSTDVMFYNKTFFDEHGLKVPTTYAELAEVAAQATAITGKPSVGFDSTANLGIYGPMNWGAKYADIDGNLFMFDEENLPKTMAFYEYFKKGIEGGYFRLAGEDRYCSGPFSAGTIVMYIGSSAGTQYILPDGFEAAASYAPVGDYPAVIQQGGNFCGFTTGDALTDLATSIFLEYMYNPDAAALYSANTGYAPSNSAALEKQVYKDSVAVPGIGPAAKAVSSTYPDGVLAFDPPFASSYETRTILAGIVDALALDPKADIPSLIEEAKANIANL